MDILQYVVIASFCISAFYLAYILFFYSDTNFRLLRLYLVISLVLSLILPMTRFELKLDFGQTNQQVVNTPSIVKQEMEKGIQENIHMETDKEIGSNEPAGLSNANWRLILQVIYLLVTTTLIFKIVIQLLSMLKILLKSDKKKFKDYTLIYNKEIRNSFSFFSWIFISATIKGDKDFDQIMAHEKIHVVQFHSIDLLLVELIAAVMWFNPLVWMMRREVQLVHEYLADEGALSTGIDRLGYQALLVNQVAEERFVSLSSSFNRSLIKKRMIMMTKSKFNQGTKLKILALFPLSIILFLGVACVNGQKSNNENIVAAVSPTRMNVMYIGVDNPVKIAVSGYKASEIVVSVKENGTITGSNGEYIVHPKKRGNLFIVVKHNGKVIQETEFRVKVVPDPVAAIMVDYKPVSNGSITKSELLKAGGIVAFLQNFDFDLQFKIESFVLSATVPSSTTVLEEITKFEKFSPAQVDLIKSLVKNQKLMIEHIVASGPDGFKRKLGPMVFTISD